MPSVQTTFRKLKTGELPVAVWVECVEQLRRERAAVETVPGPRQNGNSGSPNDAQVTT